MQNKYFQKFKSKSAQYWFLSMTANILAWLYTLAIGRSLDVVELGTLATLMSIQSILTVPASSVSSMIARFVPHIKIKNDASMWKKFYHHYFAVMIATGTIFTLAIIIGENFVENLFHIQSTYLILIFAPSIFLLYLIYFQKGIMSGHLSFHHIGIISLSESILKLVFILILPIWPYSKLNFVVMSMSTTLVILYMISKSLVSQKSVKLDGDFGVNSLYFWADFSESWLYFANSIGSRLIIIFLTSIDMLLIKHFLPGQAGIYALLSITGKVILFLGTSLQALINPQVSARIASGQDSKKPFIKIISIVFTLTFGVYSMFLLAPDFMSRLLIGEKSYLIVKYLPFYGLGIVCWSITICFQSYATAMKNFSSQKIFLVTAISQVVLIYFYHENLFQVINILTSTYFISAILVISNTLIFEKKSRINL